MKKFLHISVLLICILIFSGVLILGGVYFFCISDNNKRIEPGLTNFEYTFDSDEIESINVHATYGNVEIVRGEALKIEFKNIYRPCAKCTLDDDRLEVDVNTENDYSIFGWDIDIGYFCRRNGVSTTVIYLPEKFTPDIIDVELGQGNILLDDISTRKMVCQSLIGNFDFTDVKISAQGAFQLGFGRINTRELETKNSSIDICWGNAKLGLAKNTTPDDIVIETLIGKYKFVE